jgi:hypothetical protein
MTASGGPVLRYEPPECSRFPKKNRTDWALPRAVVFVPCFAEGETGDHTYSRYRIGMHLLFSLIWIAFDIDRTWRNSVLTSF